MNGLTVGAFALSLAAAPCSIAGAATEASQDRPLTIPDPNDPVFDGLEGPGVIQVAILLDTSNSMDGLINQAKSRLWDVTTRLAKARCGNDDASAPRFEIALYQYGNSSLPAHEGYIQRLHGFTAEIDEVAQTLFALTTNGGQEYCPWVVADATRDLDWKSSAEVDGPVYRAIFIAGNEPFTQGPVDYTVSVPGAAAKDIVVNTIFCGSEPDGANSGWLHAAHLGGGEFASINGDRVRRHIPAPQDDRLLELNAELNKTYLPFGDDGARYAQRQIALDDASARVGQREALGRATAKAQLNYSNSSWDLVDAAEAESFDITEVDEARLPEAMRGITDDEKVAYVAKMAAERASLQASINELAAAREIFLADALAKEATDGLDNALLDALNAQAVQAGFRFVE